MASSPHDDTHVSFNFSDDLLVEPQNAPSASGKETQSIRESGEDGVKQLGNVKPPHDGVLEGGLQKEEQEPDKIWSFRCADNGDLMTDKVPMLDKTGAAGTRVANQAVGLNGKSGDDSLEVDGFIEFKDCVGRRFRLPYKGVKKWKVISFSQRLLPQVCHLHVL